MGQKRIVIAECIFEDLIYGRLRGPVKSDAPKRMKITGVYSEIGKSSLQHTGNVCVYVEHPDFEEVKEHTEVPILDVTFTSDVDSDTQELIIQLNRIAQFLEEDGQKVLNTIGEILATWDAKYYQLFEERNELRRENNFLQSKIDTIVNIVREHKSND